MVRASSVMLELSKIQFASLKVLMDMMMFSMEGGKYAYDRDLGKQTKHIHRGFIRIIVENMQYNLFKLFKAESATKEASRKPKWVSDKDLCNLSKNKLDTGGM